ncbi:cyclic nucleotide-binding domain-containing protein [Aquimarina brevivitae]|uniref:CRP-like cAMP-binding protein n=1 Tax=Aquimarina brevivitae TaxID=323412 RepID=A0A4V2F7D6_9FLAO|nr:cyclic nucleotide-binding domain-containing protein [Aquimarina brevivitae]RZS99449.1 CRP-like cAMP-binding protein [Aquimarina brevivitae]
MKKVLFLLGHLTDLDIEWMIHNGSKKNLKNHEELISKGEEIENIYIILSGKLSITDGKQEIAAIGPGEIVGEMSFLESRAPSVSVIAAEETVVYSISRAVMNEKLDTDLEFRSNFYYSLALFLSNRLRKTTNKLGFESPDEEDMIDTNVLDGVAQAGARFSQILNKFSEV